MKQQNIQLQYYHRQENQIIYLLAQLAQLDFLHKFKKKPTRDKIISFHVKSPFTSVSLDEAITMILIKVQDAFKTETNTPKKKIKDLLLLQTKLVHFTFIKKHRFKQIGLLWSHLLGDLSQYFYEGTRRRRNTNFNMLILILINKTSL